MTNDPKKLGIPNICFSLSTDDNKCEKIYKKQRIERGFDDSETWALSETVSKFILPRLICFKENCTGSPENISFNEWQKILEVMIICFKTISNKKSKDYTEDDMENINNGLELFKTWFFELWW